MTKVPIRGLQRVRVMAVCHGSRGLNVGFEGGGGAISQGFLQPLETGTLLTP